MVKCASVCIPKLRTELKSCFMLLISKDESRSVGLEPQVHVTVQATYTLGAKI